MNRTSLKLGKGIVTAMIVGALGWAGTATAQQTIGVEPPVVVHTGVPGQTITLNIRVGNPGPKPLRVRISLSDWSYSPAGELSFAAPGKNPASAALWTRLSDASVNLAGFEVQTIRYTITVPKDATPGSHWGMVFFQGEALDAPPGAIATFNTRVAHTFYVNIPPTTQTGKIAGIFGRPSQPANKSFNIAIQYVNTGNIAQQLQGRVEIRDSSGKMVAVSLVKLQVVLPGATRIIQVSLGGPLPAGDYTALAILNYGDKGKDIAGEYTFTLKQPLIESP